MKTEKSFRKHKATLDIKRDKDGIIQDISVKSTEPTERVVRITQKEADFHNDQKYFTHVVYLEEKPKKEVKKDKATN